MNRYIQSYVYVTGSAKTLYVHVFYTFSQKQLLNPNSLTDFCTKIKLENFYIDGEIFTMLQ